MTGVMSVVTQTSKFSLDFADRDRDCREQYSRSMTMKKYSKTIIVMYDS